MSHPVCTIIAGPNGAGKTTFALNYLSEVAHCKRFINADLIDDDYNARFGPRQAHHRINNP